MLESVTPPVENPGFLSKYAIHIVLFIVAMIGWVLYLVQFRKNKDCRTTCTLEECRASYPSMPCS